MQHCQCVQITLILLATPNLQDCLKSKTACMFHFLSNMHNVSFFFYSAKVTDNTWSVHPNMFLALLFWMMLILLQVCYQTHSLAPTCNIFCNIAHKIFVKNLFIFCCIENTFKLCGKNLFFYSYNFANALHETSFYLNHLRLWNQLSCWTCPFVSRNLIDAEIDPLKVLKTHFTTPATKKFKLLP